MKNFSDLKGWFARKSSANASAGQDGAKPPKIRNMLLQTYFTSLICLVLCVGMFLGTSYAWFSSEVVNESNEIYVGTLKVGLYKIDSTTQAPLDLTDPALGYKLFDGSVRRWEPNYTALETIQITNEGDLAFNYELTFREAVLESNGSSNLEEIADHFEIWVFNHAGRNFTKPKSFEDLQKTSGWSKVGTLKDVLNGGTVLSGNMTTVRQDDKADDPTTLNDTPDGVKTTDTYTIAIHMNELADSSAMGSKILLNVRLVAYQLTSEADDLGNKEYDKNIVGIADAAGLNAALADKKTVLLASDLTLSSSEDRICMDGGQLDGNGKTVTYSGEMVDGNSAGVLTTTGGEISKLTIAGGSNGRALYVTELKSDLTVSDCTFSGAYAFNLNSDKKADNVKITFINTTFSSWTSYANVAKHVYFTDCDINANLRPYGDTTLTNCNISVDALDLSHLENGETVTLINTTYRGKEIENVVITNNNGTLEITGTGAELITASSVSKVITLN